MKIHAEQNIANGDLIVAACNAAQDANPADPLAAVAQFRRDTEHRAEIARMAAPPAITPLVFDPADFAEAERMARHLGYRQTAYTSASGMWGLFCLRDRATDHAGCIIKTREFGLLFVQCAEDVNLEAQL